MTTAAAARKKSTVKRTLTQSMLERDNLDTFSGCVGSKIRKLRKLKEWSREQLAEKVTRKGWDLTVSSLQSYENGYRPIPLNALPAFAKALNCKVADLLTV